MALSEQDIASFFDPTLIENQNYLICDYFFETTAEPKISAASICQEMSTAQWKRPNVAEDLRKDFAAKVVHLEVLKHSDKPLYAFPWSQQSQTVQCKMTIAYPHIHFADSIPNMLSALAGEGAFYAPKISCLRLLDIRFPEIWLHSFKGPQFGLAGLRELAQVFDRPFFIGVVKPNLGLSPKDFAQIAGEAWSGGLDIAKDDEMLVSPVYSPLKQRIQACAQTATQIKNKTGKPCLMLANISDEIDRLPERYHEAKSAGAHAVMLNPFFTGFSSVRSVREKSDLPIMGHFTGMALYDRIPHFGIEGKVLVKLQRILGCDMIGLPGFGSRMHNTERTVLENIKACLMPLGKIKPSLPIPGGSDWAGTLPSLYENIGHTDFGFISGRGVFGHPDGPESGAKSLVEAWDCIQKSLSLADGAKTRPALAKALEAFGK